MAVIVVVDDVEVVRMVLRRMLLSGGHTVHEAANATEAKALVRDRQCDLVVTDLWMPGENGLGLIQDIKSRRPGLPVIAITGGAPRTPAEFSFTAAMDAGADRILIKPIATEELLDAVKTEIARAESGPGGEKNEPAANHP